jgi:hypothetical protein
MPLNFKLYIDYTYWLVYVLLPVFPNFHFSKTSNFHFSYKVEVFDLEVDVLGTLVTSRLGRNLILKSRKTINGILSNSVCYGPYACKLQLRTRMPHTMLIGC